MHVLGIGHVLCVVLLVASVCSNELEYEGNYADYYDNEVSQDQQEGGSPNTPCPGADFTRWDKLFIALEDSHMRQNMLLDSVERCCGETASLRTRVEKLAGLACQQCASSAGSACRTQAERATLGLHQGLMELREEEAERERRLNATVQMLLPGGHEQKVRPRRPEEGCGHTVVTSGAEGSRTGHRAPQERDASSSSDSAEVERALVAIATELQRVHLQLSRVIEKAGTLRKDRGDT